MESVLSILYSFVTKAIDVKEGLTCWGGLRYIIVPNIEDCGIVVMLSRSFVL